VSGYHKGKTSLHLNKAARYDGVLGCSSISWTVTLITSNIFTFSITGNHDTDIWTLKSRNAAAAVQMCRISDWRKNIYDKLTILGEQSHEQSIQDKLQLTKSVDHFIRKLPITAGCQLPANTVAEMSKLLPAVQLWLVSSPEQYKKHHINCQKSQDTQHICNLSYRYNHTHTHTHV